jgi:hypothetical protein
MLKHLLLTTALMLPAVPVYAAPPPDAKKDEKPAEKKPEAKPKPAKPEAFLTPETAGPDYKVQGEYEGPLGEEKAGAHVMARGDGNFEVVIYRGGLPGAGWNGKDKAPAKAKTADGKTVVFDKPETPLGEIADGKLTGKSPKGTPFSFTRVERKSPTLGEKPPEGAVVLFDGKKETAEAEWNKVKLDAEGNLITLGTGGYLTKRKFGDCKIHVEFRLPFMPKANSQGRGNSGVYAAGRYETQVLDSFGLAGKNNEAGGIYEVSDPAVNMCFPPLQWQTYEIEYTAPKFDAEGKKTANARLTVVHNGVKVQDNVEVKGPTRAAPVKESPEPGPIHLQDHGDPVVFRNIWVVEKK